MEYTPRTVTSQAGLSQEEALESLQKHPQFKQGTIIKSIRQRHNKWIAKLEEPKTAEFPPSDDDDDDSDSEDTPEVKVEEEDSDDSGDSGDSEGDSSDSKPPFGEDGPKPEKAEGPEGLEGAVAALTALVTQIADKLGVGGPDEGLGADEVPGGPGAAGPPPPPHKGPGRPPGPGGAPPGPKPGGGVGPAARPVRDVPPGTNPMAGFASTIPSFTASTTDDLTIAEAKEDLNKEFPEYKVRQIKRDASGKLIALLSNR